MMYFSYLPFFKFQIYRGGRQFGFKDVDVPKFIPEQIFIPIDSAEFKNDNLVITSRRGYRFFGVKHTVTLKEIRISDNFATIKKLLRIV